MVQYSAYHQLVISTVVHEALGMLCPMTGFDKELPKKKSEILLSLALTVKH